jgi:hypothetical protein
MGAVLLTKGDHGLETVHHSVKVRATVCAEGLNTKVVCALTAASVAAADAPLGQTLQSALEFESLQDLLHSCDTAAILHSSSSTQTKIEAPQCDRVRPFLSHRHLKLFLATEMRKQLQIAGKNPLSCSKYV